MAAANTEPRINGYGVVKSVLSGDSIVVFGASTDPAAAHPEKQISFSGLLAPRFSRSKNQQDEAFAFESREFLRKLLIGKIVSFNTSKANGESTRLYGTVYLNNENVNQMAIRAGWLTVKPPPEGSRPSSERKELMEIEEEARAAKVGRHADGLTPEEHTRELDFNPDATDLLRMFKGKKVPAIVSQIRDGSVIRCEVQKPRRGKKPEWMVVSLILAGAKSSRVPMTLGYRQAEYKRKKDLDPDFSGAVPTEGGAEPYSMEALSFVEKRLLHRDVEIVMLAADKANNVYGTLMFGGGDITARILETGLAKFVPWTASLLEPVQASHYEALGASAKEKKLCLHSKETVEGEEEEEELKKAKELFTAKVVMVQSGDIVEVEDKAGNKIRYALASIRAMRLGRRGEKDEPWAAEAKEFLRKKLIGKDVSVLPEYKRTSNIGREMSYASLFIGSENISESLVQQGFAEVIPHRQDDPRASGYAKFLQLEFDAKQAGLGLHSTVPYNPPNIVDFSIRAPRPKKGEENLVSEKPQQREAGRAQGYVGFLKRDKNVQGIVEFCFSAGRLKIFIPKHKVIVVLVLAGIKTPSAGDDYADEANQFVRSRIQQHSVRLEVEAADRGDNFIGSVFVNGQNLAEMLLDAGLAMCYSPTPNQSTYYTELLMAEAKAKEAKLKIFENWVEKAPDEEGADEKANNNTRGVKDTMQVSVVDVSDATAFFIRITDDPSIAIVEERMAEYNETPDTSRLEKPRKGDIIAAKYNVDDQWYRVRYDGKSGDEHRVFFIDFGNPEIMSKESLAPLPEDLANIPGLARSCVLAGLKAPHKNSDYFHDAAVAFNGRAFDHTLTAKVEMCDDSYKLHLSLTDADEETGLTINEMLVQEGWCRVIDHAPSKLTKLCTKLKIQETIAKQARLFIWEYGDVSDEESEEEEGAKPKNDGRPPQKRR